jgi:hypothetical protein
MFGKKSLSLILIVLATLAFNAPRLAISQQVQPCDNLPTAGKTDKQIALEACSCQQAHPTAATGNLTPTFVVGASPFGRASTSRVSKRTRREAEETLRMYKGLVIPDAKDLKSPEVVGLKEKVSSAREEAWQRVEKHWQHFYRVSFVSGVKRAKYRGLFKAELLEVNPAALSEKDNPEDYLKPKIYADLLVFLRKSDSLFHNVEQEHRRLTDIHELNDKTAALPEFDWRKHGIDYGSMMNQGTCQSCWAFAAVSVYQSTWSLEQIRTGQYYDQALASDEPAEQLDRFASVQQLLNCVGKVKGSCDGGWHGWAFDFMVSSHVPHIPDREVRRRLDDPRHATKPGDIFEKIEEEGYTGKVTPCINPFRQTKVKRGGQTIMLKGAGTGADLRLQAGSDNKTTNFDRALAWGYVNQEHPDEIPSVAQLKQALIEHGPLAVTIIMDKCFEVYQSGVFNGMKTAGPKHAMTLIGWDDSKQAWLIKNQWGEAWGEKGYGWVAYGSNNIGKYAAWIQPSPYTNDK